MKRFYAIALSAIIALSGFGFTTIASTQYAEAGTTVSQSSFCSQLPDGATNITACMETTTGGKGVWAGSYILNGKLVQIGESATLGDPNHGGGQAIANKYNTTVVINGTAKGNGTFNPK